MLCSVQKRTYEIALVIGRFQPFHKGHLFLIKKALTIASKLVIGIGSSNVVDGDNPLSYRTRRSMILTVFKREGLQERLLMIVPIPDVPHDDEWLHINQKRVGHFDVSIGNNDWVNGIFKKASIPVIEVPYLKKALYSGTAIRMLVKEGKPWKDRIPHYLVKPIAYFLKTPLL